MRASSLLLVLACAACAVAVSAHFQPHPLDAVKVENIQLRTGTGTITIEASVFNGTGSFATVSWADVPSPFPGNFDWIGVWSPKPDNWTTTTPAKYKYVISDASGSGSSNFWFLNMRDSYTVAYFTGGLTTPTLLAVSDPVDFSNYHVPMHIHLALTQDPTQMKVMWTTHGNMFPSLNYGTSATNLSHSILRISTTSYASTDFCGAPASTKGWRIPGYLHTALITALTPNTEYFFQVGSESSQSKSHVLSFYSAPQPSATDLDFIVFGDLGQVEIDGSNEASMMDGSILTTTALQADFADGSVQANTSAAVFHIGDISYARGYATLWEQFFYQIANVSQHVPWMTCDGNHERDFPRSGSLYNGTDSGGECGVAYEKRFQMPTSAQDQTWWNLTYGPIAWVVISTEHDFAAGSAQYQWFESALAAVNRRVTPYLFVAGHRPMYIDSTNNSPGGGDLTTAAALRESLEPLMNNYKVDAAFWGHHHSYQRSCPVFKMQCYDQSEGTVHIVTGASGAGFSTNIQPDMPSWAEFVEDNQHGYTRGHVRGNTLTLDFVSSQDRSIIDSVTINSKFPQALREDSFAVDF
jgi:hypothetical protein